MKTMPMIDPAIFRAYDIRGIVGETLSVGVVYWLGKAIGSEVRAQGVRVVYVARDGRLSGPKLLSALCDGLMSVGCAVIDLGMVPTPILYYAASKHPDETGIMLTGSHNPRDYNGLKMVVKGVTLSEDAIQSLYQRLKRRDFYPHEAGSYETMVMAAHYLKAVTSNITLKRPLTVVIDAGNGATGEIAPRFFEALHCTVIPLFCEVDGHFPNHHPDPGEVKNLIDLKQAVLAHGADVGLAFDGDGDRLGVVTNQGTVILPDRLLMAYARAVLKEAPGATILYDVKCTALLEQEIKQFGGIAKMCKTGHALIKAAMRKEGALLAGEMSGHFFFKDKWHGGDDALYAGARLLQLLAETDQTSEVFFASLPNSVNTPELKVAIPEHEKFPFMEAIVRYVQAECKAITQSIITLDGLRVHFQEGWGLIRASNTSPYLVLRFEAANEVVLKQIQAHFKAWMQAVKADLAMVF